MQAIWNGKVLAESDATVVVEGNHYFPPESIREVNSDPQQGSTLQTKEVAEEN